MEAKKFQKTIKAAYAAVVRNLLPSVAVKHYTLKKINDRPNDDAELFLPGAEWELAHIVGEEKPHYYGTKLTRRYWSLETRVALLCRGNFELVTDICTTEELNALLFGKDDQAHANGMDIVRAFRVCEPNRKVLRNCLATYPVDQICYVVNNTPWAFGDKKLELSDVLLYGAERDLSSPYWQVARALAEWRPGAAAGFMDVIREHFTVGQIKEDQSKNFDFFFKKALGDGKSNLSKFFTYFRNNFPEYVEAIWDKIYDLPDAGRCFELEFKAIFRDLVIPGESEGRCFSALRGWSEPLRVLRIGYNLMDNPVVHRVFCQNLKALKEKFVVAGNSALWEDLLKRMLQSARSLQGFLTVYRMGAKSLQWKGVEILLHSKLLEDLSAYNVESVVASFFPFSDWEEDEAKIVLRKMAEKKVMPLAHLKELPATLKAYALQQVELQSQKELINRNVHDIWKVTLLPEAEIYLIGEVGKDFLLDYVSERGLSREAFSFLVRKSNHCAIAEAVQKQAERWHISQDQWLMLTQSQYAYLAPLVKGSIK